MSPSELPGLVRELLASRVDTFEKLELVVLLHGAPRSIMSIHDLAATLKAPVTPVRQAALELREGALVELTSTGEVQLLPPSSRDHAAVEELVRVYQEDRLSVVKALGEIAMERIRDMASRAFADAFGHKKEPDEDA